MRFLVDAQLPPPLARLLAARGHQAEHVADIDLLAAPDLANWQHAIATGAALISKDEDFVTMRAFNSSGPPIIWVRLGNTTKRELLARFTVMLPAIVVAIERREAVIEISSI